MCGWRPGRCEHIIVGSVFDVHLSVITFEMKRGTINVKNTRSSRGESPEAGEANCSGVAMAAWAAVMFVFIKLRQSCGELDAPPVLNDCSSF